MAEIDYSGAQAIDASTPDQIMFGAGSYHYDTVLNEDKTALTGIGTFFGCTNGGGKFAVVPNIVQVEVDQSTVAREGFYVKQGEEAYIETNWTQIGGDPLAKALVADVKQGEGAKVITSRETIETGDYFDNFTYIGKTVSGKPVIIVFERALCTSGLEVESKKSEQSSPTVKVNCVAKIDSGENKLPYIIIWPDASTAAATNDEGEESA